ncbi:MAG TPA: sigma factor-like helix-turn-helix DNA-binding protein [Candidatus Limnocylindrales bacterium]
MNRGGSTASRGIVLFGDVVDSRRDPVRSSAWLRTLCSELETLYPPDERVAGFGFTQGDELQGLLAATADPLLAVLHAALDPEAMRMRWAVALGQVEVGTGPATERTGEAFLRARELLEATRFRRDGLLMSTGEPGADRLLDNLAPLLAELLDDLSPRQRVIARLMLLEGLRQAEVAAELGVARATVSVAYARGRVRPIDRLATALRSIFGAGRLALEDAAPAGAKG